MGRCDAFFCTHRTWPTMAGFLTFDFYYLTLDLQSQVGGCCEGFKVLCKMNHVKQETLSEYWQKVFYPIPWHFYVHKLKYISGVFLNEFNFFRCLSCSYFLLESIASTLNSVSKNWLNLVFNNWNFNMYRMFHHFSCTSDMYQFLFFSFTFY